MDEVAGILAYDLAGQTCPECGRPVSQRLMFGGVTTYGCATCKEVVTRHRCTERPALDALAIGDSWECPDCGSTWTAVMEEDVCGECGRSGMVPGWLYQRGDRVDTAPRYEHQPFTPFRNVFRRPEMSAEAAGQLSGVLERGGRAYLEWYTSGLRNVFPRWHSGNVCYPLPSGNMVHVKPGCRC